MFLGAKRGGSIIRGGAIFRGIRYILFVFKCQVKKCDGRGSASKNRGLRYKSLNGRRSQMADGHLGWAQVADAQCVSHLGLGSNFQSSLIWLMPNLKL